MFKVLGFKV